MKFLTTTLLLMGALTAFAGDKDIKLGQEKIPASEAGAIEETNKIIRDFLQEQYGDGAVPVGDAERAVHPKMHGTVRATVHVHQVPEWLREGMFQEGAKYKAWIRLSNASPRPQHDKKGDSRGFAMKVLGVSGERILEGDKNGYTQDFTLNSFPTFFAKDAKNYQHFVESLMIKNSMLRYIFPSINPIKWRFREAWTFLGLGLVKVSSPLNLEYHSMAPFRHGPDETIAVKYRVRPVGGVQKVDFDSSDENYLRQALIEQLAEGEVHYEFAVQRQVDPKKMPIEDPRIKWKTKDSPFIPVATIVIPKQEFTSARQVEFGKNLTFNPWQGLQAHRPLGGINRLRLCSYLLSNDIRHALNLKPSKEPPLDGSIKLY